MRRRRGDEAAARDAELAALADGSLAPESRGEVEARVASSPELGRLLAEQQRAVAFARDAAAEVDAPAGLRRRIEAERGATRRPALRNLALAGAGAAALAVIAVAVVFVASGPSPRRFDAALEATALAPGARGHATLTKTSSGWRIELDATGLPRLDRGRFYEAWLRNPTGILVPIGTFNEGRHVTLWAGVSPEAFTAVTVTRERADGDQASSGAKVLAGTVDTGSG